MGVTDLVSEIKRTENYPDLEKLGHVIQHGLRGFIGKNIEGVLTGVNDLIHVCLLCKLLQLLPTFPQN